MEPLCECRHWYSSHIEFGGPCRECNCACFESLKWATTKVVIPVPKSLNILIDRRALLAAELQNDEMIDGYADGWFNFSCMPPPQREFRRWADYMRGYERAVQQRTTSIDDEYSARHGLTYSYIEKYGPSTLYTVV